MVIIIFLWKFLTNNRLWAIDSFVTILRYLLGQSNNKEARSVAHHQNKSLTLSYTTLLVIWLLVSVVLNRSYTSLLLNTYFNVKTKPVVQSLSDIRNNKDLLIAGIREYLTLVNQDFKISIQDLLIRLEEDPDNFPNPLNSYRIAEKVISGRSVLIGNSYISDAFLEQTKYHHDKLVVVDKHLPEFLMFHVSKDFPISKEIYF